jgi:uncharacterized membrane protein (DUF4010 family)
MLAFVAYPILPLGSVDPWGLIDLRPAWVTVLLIAGLGFTNYLLLKLYGPRGIELTGFLGGLVNSTVTVTELSQRASTAGGRLSGVTYRGVVLATAAMLVRNTVILGLLAPAALLESSLPLALMIAGALAAVSMARRRASSGESEVADAQIGEAWRNSPLLTLESPFSLSAALKFGLIFFALRIAGTLAQRALGDGGFYAVSLVGGLVSSAGAVAAAANLTAAGTLAPQVAGVGAIIASAMSVIISLPLVARIGKDRALTVRIAWVLGGIVLLGAFGCIIQLL